MGCCKSKADAREASGNDEAEKGLTEPVKVNAVERTLEHDLAKAVTREKSESTPRPIAKDEHERVFTFDDFSRKLGMRVDGDLKKEQHHHLIWVEAVTPGGYAEELGVEIHSSLVAMERYEIFGKVATFSFHSNTTDGIGTAADGTPMKTLVHRTRGLGMQMDAYRRVTAVDPGGQAAENNIAVGDLVTSVGGVNYNSTEHSDLDVITTLTEWRRAGKDVDIILNGSETKTGRVDFMGKATADFMGHVTAAKMAYHRPDRINSWLKVSFKGHTDAPVAVD
jgi:hypothetical protein